MCGCLLCLDEVQLIDGTVGKEMVFHIWRLELNSTYYQEHIFISNLQLWNTHSAINQLNFIKTKQAATHHNTFLISWKKWNKKWVSRLYPLLYQISWCITHGYLRFWTFKKNIIKTSTYNQGWVFTGKNWFIPGHGKN